MSDTAQILTGPSGWVYVPVRERHVAAALAAVCRLMADDDPAADDEGGASTQAERAKAITETDLDGLVPSGLSRQGSAATKKGDPNGVWCAGGYTTLRGASSVSAGRICRIGDALAAQEGLIPTGELADATGLSSTQIRQALGKLTLYVKARPEVYGPKVLWPFGWAFGREIAETAPYEFHYFMTTTQRRAWQAAD